MESTPQEPVKASVPPPTAQPALQQAPTVVTAPPATKARGSFKLPKLQKAGVKASRAPKVEKALKVDRGPKRTLSRKKPDSPAALPPAESPVEIFAPTQPRHPGRSVRSELTLPSNRTLGLMVAYVVAYVALAELGMQLANANHITPWYPAAGLAVGVMAIGGVRWTVPTFIAAALAAALDDASLTMALVLAALTAVFYGAASLQLGRVLDRSRPLSRVNQAWWLIGAGVVGAPLAIAPLFVGYLALFARLPASDYASMVRTFVLGDALGVVTIAPAVLLAAAGYRAAGLRGILPSKDFMRPGSLAALIALCSLTPAIYLGAGQDLRAVGVLPLCWLALRFGISGTVVGSLAWTGTAALLVGFLDRGGNFGGLQSFLLTGTMLALIIGSVVSERERSQRELRHLAMHDPGSGLPNEPHLLELLGSAFTNAGGREVTLVIIRFAGLRQVSAALRKADTDELVAMLARRIAEIAGPQAMIARPGFDRFAVFGTGADSERRQAIAQRLIDELKAPLAVDSREVFVDPRIGITVALPGEAPDVVLAHGDHAADVTTSADGNRIGYYDSSIERAHRERVELTEDLRLAVLRGELLLAFQPIVTAKEGRVVAAEALLRWVDKKRGPVSPMDFIPVAEDTGLILPIGRWVLNEACRRAASWPHVAGRPIDVSVNVSPIQLMDEGFLQDVAGALQRSHLTPNRLRIEITEGIAVEDIDLTILRINQLREMGVETMLDDFGTGHSSLAWVQRLPVTCIKIDRAFVKDIAVDGIDRAIVHASLYLSRALGTETVAEGVETEAQREQLVRMGCQKLQGYLFARPQPADVFPDWLIKQRALTSAPQAAAAPSTAPHSAAPHPAAPHAAAPPPVPQVAHHREGPRPPLEPQPVLHGLQAMPEDPRFAA